MCYANGSTPCGSCPQLTRPLPGRIELRLFTNSPALSLQYQHTALVNTKHASQGRLVTTSASACPLLGVIRDRVYFLVNMFPSPSLSNLIFFKFSNQ